MRTQLNPALYWAPRALCIVFIGFVSLFALDVFNQGYGFWRTLLSLLMHLVPSLVMVAALAVAWRWEWVGTAMFVLCGVFFIVIARGPWAKVVFALPCFVAACLFLINWHWRMHHGGSNS